MKKHANIFLILWNATQCIVSIFYKHLGARLCRHARRAVLPAIFPIALFMTLPGAFSAEPNISAPLLSNAQIPTRLKTDSVTRIAKDSYGYLWVGTHHGLLRFDGNGVSNLGSEGYDQGLRFEVTGISEDSQGDMIVSTYNNGLFRWNRLHSTFERIQGREVNSGRIISAMTKAGGNDFWINSNEGLNLFNTSQERYFLWFKRHPLYTNLADPRAISESVDGATFVFSERSLFKIKHKTREILLLHEYSSSPLENDRISVLSHAPNGGVFIGTLEGNLVLTDDNGRPLASASITNVGWKNASITDLAVSGDRLIIGTDNGLYTATLDLKNVSAVDNKTSESSSLDVHDLLPDGSHVWVGTTRGLKVLFFPTLELIHSGNSPIDNEVLAFTQDSEGSLWVGTYDGLFEFDSKEQQQSSFREYANSSVGKLLDQRVTALESDGGSVYIGFFSGGVQKVDKETKKASTNLVAELSKTHVTDLEFSEETRELWIASFGKGLFRLNPDGSTQSYLDSKQLEEERITLLYRSKKLGLLVVCINSIYRYHEETDKFTLLDLRFSELPLAPFIYSLAEDELGALWLGTRYHWIYRWNQEKNKSGIYVASPISRSRHVRNTTVYSIFFDHSNSPWVSTRNGIARVSSNGEISRRYTIKDGAQDLDFSYGSGFRDAKGNIYFGGINGYNYFHPSQMSTQEELPTRTNVTKVTLSTDASIELSSFFEDTGILVPYRSRYVAFEFSSMDLVTQGSTYRRKLIGFDRDWIDNGTSNKATYTNLPPGEYTFEVQGANSSGIWDPVGARVGVRVLPPPWASGWAYSLYLLIFMLFGWLLHRVYHSYVVERRAEEMLEEMHMAERAADESMQDQIEYQDELIRSAFDHKLETLSLVSTFESRPGQTKALKSGQIVPTGLQRRMAILKQLETYTFYGPTGPSCNLFEFTDAILQEMMDECPINTETVVTVNDMPKKLMAANVSFPVAVMVYELLDNCMLHAFDGEAPANYIFAEFKTELDESGRRLVYTLCVRDNGRGAPDNTLDMVESGSGLSVVHEIAELLEGEMSVDNENGFRVVIEFPEPPERDEF